MNVATTYPEKPLEIQMTAEQHRVITEAAERERRSVTGFVLTAALNAATRTEQNEDPKLSDEEAGAIVKQAQEAFRATSDSGRDLVEELFAGRRADAMRG